MEKSEFIAVGGPCDGMTIEISDGVKNVQIPVLLGDGFGTFTYSRRAIDGMYLLASNEMTDADVREGLRILRYQGVSRLN